jgi:hypothetical protein
MRGRARFVLITYIPGLSRVPGLDAFVSVTLHLFVCLSGGLEFFVYVPVHLLLGLIAGCRLLRLLRCCRESRRGENNEAENRRSHRESPLELPPR